MIEILFTVCLVASPSICEERRIPFPGPMTACTFAAQFEIASWSSSHPKWAISSWRCSTAELRI